ncbi:MAG: helix-turn-helix transcriptional regulator [Oscillospiraceae bacterium]|nr:helix-turn-helix transcriptional regulator [Oscillospiraceae bacterium]
MILADKIILMRKQQGWNQEQLAEQLGVSRQAVSKWESALSIPDLDKIIKMSNIFGVPTDYLLKDEISELPKGSTAETATSYDCDDSVLVTVEDANTYMSLCEKLSKFVAFGVALCILSPVPLIILGGLSELSSFPLTEAAAGGTGVAVLLVLVAIAVAIFIVCGMQTGKWEFLEKNSITLEYGIKGIVEKKKSQYEKKHIFSIAAGVVFCITGAVPVMIGSAFTVSDIDMVYSVAILLVFIACGVFLMVRSGIVNGCYQKLLQEGEYTQSEKKARRRLETVSTVYWCIIVAVFLLWSFATMEWHRTWIIWPVAGVFYAVVEAVAKNIVLKK